MYFYIVRLAKFLGFTKKNFFVFFFIEIIPNIKNYIIQQKNLTKVSKKHPLKGNEIAFVCCFEVGFGIGDIIMVAGLLPSIKQKYPFLKPVLLIKRNHRFIKNVFSHLDEVREYDEKIDIFNFPDTEQRLEKGKYYRAHPSYEKLEIVIGFKGLTLFDSYKLLFRLPSSCSLAPVKPITESSKNRVRNLLTALNLDETKLILLASNANSAENLPFIFWEELTRRLIEKGYKVLFNTPNSLVDNQNVYHIVVDLEDIPEFCKNIKHTISMRSGLCDLLALYVDNLTVVYPDIQWYQSSLLEGSSLIRMGFSKNIKEYDINMDNNNFLVTNQEIISKIINL